MHKGSTPHRVGGGKGGGEVVTNGGSGTFPDRSARGQPSVEAGEGVLGTVHICHKSMKWRQECGHLRLEESGNTKPPLRAGTPQ